MTRTETEDQRVSVAQASEDGDRTGWPVVVGIDGSAAAVDAAQWAAQIASATGTTERLVHALVVPEWIADFIYTPAPTEDTLDHELTVRGENLLAAAAAAASATAPDVRLSTHVVHGSVSGTLAHESRHARMVVVGAPPAGAPAPGSIAGSMNRLIRQAGCPVVIHRRGAGHGGAGSVVVGVDGSSHADEALGRALEVARLLHMPVRVLHAFRVSALTLLDAKGGFVDWDKMQAARTHWLERHIEPLRVSAPDVDVSVECVEGSAASVLASAASDRDLVVVGARGLNRATGLLVGSVSQSVIHHARCSVMVVP
ncbi:universal stress protein [Williamsia sp. SKLECPSW1]